MTSVKNLSKVLPTKLNPTVCNGRPFHADSSKWWQSWFWRFFLESSTFRRDSGNGRQGLHVVWVYSFLWMSSLQGAVFLCMLHPLAYASFVWCLADATCNSLAVVNAVNVSLLLFLQMHEQHQEKYKLISCHFFKIWATYTKKQEYVWCSSDFIFLDSAYEGGWWVLNAWSSTGSVWQMYSVRAGLQVE